MSDPTDPHRQVPAIRVFPSSSSDVQEERVAVSRVIARLSVTYAEFVNLQVDPWESHFYEANRGFQQGIEAMSQYDVVVGIFWKRLGTPLSTQQMRRADGSAYESGTVFEIETALESSAITGRPSVLVFRRTSPVLFTEQGVDAERAQKIAFAVTSWRSSRWIACCNARSAAVIVTPPKAYWICHAAEISP